MMKFIHSALLLLLAANFSLAKSPAFYEVDHPVKNAKLDQNHGRFILDCKSLNSKTDSLNVKSIEYSCNGVIRKVKLDANYSTELITSPGEYGFQFYAGKNYFEIETWDDIHISGGYDVTIHIFFDKALEGMMYHKPVIYTYSPKPQQTQIELKPKGNFTFTYPTYEDGWKGTANPDGSFTINNKTYPYLFWEGENPGKEMQSDFSTGFVVRKNEVTAFLEEKLTQMGLNQKEQTDFITFWAPRMMQVDRGFVKFLFNEDYDQIATLNVSPKPDHIFRVYLLWTPLNRESVTPDTQQIPAMKREGFYLLEWGGSELPVNSSNLTLKH